MASNEYTPEFAEKVNRNEWHDRSELDAVVAVIKELSAGDIMRWSWARNTRCKYVDIRIDMRDGGFVLRDYHGIRISPEQVSFQRERSAARGECKRG